VVMAVYCPAVTLSMLRFFKVSSLSLFHEVVRKQMCSPRGSGHLTAEHYCGC
jgi:hypothetical protein